MRETQRTQSKLPENEVEYILNGITRNMSEKRREASATGVPNMSAFRT